MTTCPSTADLTLPEGDRPAWIAAHLRSCRRCHALLAALGESDAVAAEAVDAGIDADRPVAPAEWAPGLVVAVATDGAGERMPAALIEVSDVDALVAPISEVVAYATNWDLLIERSVLGYDAIAQVWNEGRVLVEQLTD